MTEENPPLPPDPEPPKRKPFGWPFWLLLIGSLVILYGFAETGLEQSHKTDRSEAISASKQIGLALFEFENQYGSFPSKDTLAIIEAAHPNHNLDLSGNSSNALLRQLYVDTDSSPEFLKKGKFHFAYISGLSSAGNPTRPIVLGPIIPGTKKFDGKAVVLHVDNSARTYTINKDGHIMDKGIDLLSPKHPIWNGKVPDIRYPE